MGLNPDEFTFRSKIATNTDWFRLLKTTLIELGPKGTGKSHIFRIINLNVDFGEEVSKAKLCNLVKLGLVGYWDVVSR
jgi:predicted ATP-dependent Lon-type protease